MHGLHQLAQKYGLAKIVRELYLVSVGVGHGEIRHQIGSGLFLLFLGGFFRVGGDGLRFSLGFGLCGRLFCVLGDQHIVGDIGAEPVVEEVRTHQEHHQGGDAQDQFQFLGHVAS